jgi:hypothetical protein
MENQNELRLKRENFLKRFDNVEVVIGEDDNGVEVEVEVVSCPVCLGNNCDIHTFKKCNHCICKDCYNSLTKTENQHEDVRAIHRDGLRNAYTQHFVKCPLCREIEEPTKSQLKDQNLFLKKQVVDLRRNCDLVVNQLNISNQQKNEYNSLLDQTSEALKETNNALIASHARIQELKDELDKLRRPPVKREECNNSGCVRKTQRKCKDCENYCCQSCSVCKYCNP